MWKSNSSRNKGHYQMIDGEDVETGPNTYGAINDGVDDDMSFPPSSHLIMSNSPNNSATQASHSGGLNASEHRWDHIPNLDEFFASVYEYHQGGGLLTITVTHICVLIQFMVMTVFTLFITQCLDFDVLFYNKHQNTLGANITGKIHISDAVYPNCSSRFSLFTWIVVIVAFVFWVRQAVRAGYKILQFVDIKLFFHNVLEIVDAELTNTTWQDVCKKVCDVQPTIHLVINKDKIDPLDVYQRILRYENYYLAMVNRKVLPFRLALPFEIELPYLSTTLRENIYWILFTGPYAPWNGPYTIKPTVKNASTIEAMALELENTIYYVAILNVVCLPFTFVYQVLYTFFNYGHTIRSSASTLSSRTYSNLAKTELRHFNELEHELHIRLNKSYKFGIEYVNQFKSTLLDVVAKTIAFIFGSVFIIIVVLSSIDEDVLSRVEYVVTIMSVSGVIAFVSGSLVHDENTFWNPNHSMTTLVGFLHYLPEYFVGDAHTMRVRKEFNAMFQFKAQYIFEEFLSPFVTPYVLWYVIKPQSKEIIQFLNKYTVTKEGLGDICTFSQMSVDQHGDPELIDSVSEHSGDVPLTFEIDNIKKAYQVKTELSLLNFVANNPYWEPTASGKAFLEKFNKAKFNDGFVLQTMSKSQVLRKENSEDIEELPGMSDIGGVNQQSTLITSQSGMNELGGSNTVRSTSLPFDIPVQPNARAGDANSSLNMSINAIYVNKLRAQQNNINASIFNSVMRSQNRGGGTGGSVNASGIVGQHGVNPWAVPYESFFMGGSTSSINNSQTRPPTQNETERGSRMPGIVEHQESGDERGSPQTKHN